MELNNCGSENNKPEKIECMYDKKEKEFVPFVKNEKGESKEICLPKWECSEFSECTADYTFNDVIEGRFKFEGKQERTCKDERKCKKVVIEKKKCNLAREIEVKKVKVNNEEYVEIYDKETGKKVAKVKETKTKEINKLDISFVI